MMRNLRTLQSGLIGAASLLVALAALAAAPALAQTTLERVKTTGKLNLGFIDGVAPFSALGSDGKPAGYSIELCLKMADAVKARLGPEKLDVRFLPLKADAVLDSVSRGQVDLLCTATVDTLKRRERVAYSVPVFSGGIGVVLRQDAPKSLRDVLNGKVAHTGPLWRATINRGQANHTYAVRKGTVTEDWAREQSRQLGVIVNVIVVEDDAKGIDLVRSRQADAYFGERSILEQAVARDPKDLAVLDRVFDVEPMALAMGRNDDDFRLLVDTVLSKLYASKDFAGLYARYFGPLGDAGRAAFLGFARP